MIPLHDVPALFRNQRVLVIGDAILDGYLRGTSEKLCREAPAPVIQLQERDYRCGGAANTAINVASLGAHVSILTVVGNDNNGDILMERLQHAGVNTDQVIRSPTRSTVAKMRIAAASSILLRLDEGTSEPIDDHLSAVLSTRIRAVGAEFDAVIVSEYGNGLFHDKVLEAVAERARRTPCVVDARSPERFRNISPLAVKPNYEETVKLLGLENKRGGERVGQVASHAEQLLDRTGAELVYATLDAEGTLLLRRDSEPYEIPCIPRPESNTIGAGDSYISALSLSLCVGETPERAARIAAAAASVVLEKEGTSTCSSTELRSALKGNLKYLEGPKDLSERVAELRRQGKRVVFTNGCFDILHRGHVHFLRRARDLGDVLIVGLNSDISIRRIKGQGRPINTLADRIEVLAGLQSVDCMVAFEEDSPIDLLKIVRPDIFVKGGAHTAEAIPEAEIVRHLGGEVRVIPAKTGVSTSHLIQKINGRFARRGNSFKSQNYLRS